jgi:micrococcal nuclease
MWSRRSHKYWARGQRKRATRKTAVMICVTANWCAFGVFFAIQDGDVTTHLLRFAGLGAVASAVSWVCFAWAERAFCAVLSLMRERRWTLAWTRHRGPWDPPAEHQPKHAAPVQRLLRAVPGTGWLLAIGILGGAAAAYAIEFRPNNAGRPGNIAAGGGDFGLCRWAFQPNCVIDGDTIRYGGAKIRLADIDTPEISSPKCASEAALGHRAKERLLELINAGPIEVMQIGERDVDKYGRQLRVIKRDGYSIAETLVDEGLARRWDGARRSWCDDAAQRQFGVKSGGTG